MGLLKTKVLRQYDHGEELQHFEILQLNGKRYMRKNGVWLQSHIFEPEEIHAIWMLPEPGGFIRRVNPDAAVGCS